MPDQRSISTELRRYLAELPATKRSSLLVALERARLSGDSDAVQTFLVAQLRQVVAELGDSVPRIPTAERLFFDGLEPYLVDEATATKIPGRIARTSLDPIWHWIARDVAPAEVATVEKSIAERMDPTNSWDFGDVGDYFRDAVMRRLAPRLDAFLETAEQRRRLSGTIGGERGLADLVDIRAIRDGRATIADIHAMLPDEIEIADPDCVQIVGRALSAAANRTDRMVHYATVAVHARADLPHRLPALAVAIVGIDDVKIVQSAPAGRLVDVALHEIEIAAIRLDKALTHRQANVPAAQAVRDYAAYARQLRAALNLEAVPSDWSRRLTDLRTRLSGRLAKELGELFPLLRQTVRPLRSFAGKAPSRPDDHDLEKCGVLVELFDVVRSASSELALNELVARTRLEIETHVEQTTSALGDDIRATSGERRDIVVSHAAAIVRLNELLFGNERAHLVRRSFEVAAGGALPTLRRPAA